MLRKIIFELGSFSGSICIYKLIILFTMTIQQTIINLNKVLGKVQPPVKHNETVEVPTKLTVHKPKEIKKERLDFHFIKYLNLAERINGRCAMSGLIASQLIYSISHLNPVELIIHDPLPYTGLFFMDVSIISALTISNNKYDDIMMLEYEIYVARIIMLFWVTLILNINVDI